MGSYYSLVSILAKNKLAIGIKNNNLLYPASFNLLNPREIKGINVNIEYVIIILLNARHTIHKNV